MPLLKRIFGRVWRAWVKFGAKFGAVMTQVWLFVFFFFPVALMGLTSQLFGADPLGKKSKQVDSFWKDPPEPMDQDQRYKHQF